MKSSSPNPTDMAQFFTTNNHSAVPTRVNSNFQRNFGIGLGFNSPKNDTQKSITLSTRVTNDIPRYNPPKDVKTSGILDRKSSRVTPDSTPKNSNYMTSSLVGKPEPSSAATATSTNSRTTAQSRGSSADKRRTTNNGNAYSPSKMTPSYQPSSSRALQESLRRELGYSSKVKNLEIETKQDALRAPGSVRSQSTKNQEKNQSPSQSQSQNFFSGSIKKNVPQYNFEGSFKLLTSTPPNRIGYSYKNNTEPNEVLKSANSLRNSQGPMNSTSKQQQQQPLGGSAVFLGGAGTRAASRDRESIGDGEKDKAPVGFSLNRKIGFSNNGQLQYTNLSQGVIKSNNFFSSSATNWAKNSNNKEKSSPVKPKNDQELTRSANFEKKSASTTKVQDLRASLRINTTDSNDNAGSGDKLRTNSSTRENENKKEKERDDSAQKTSLDSYITKVGRGSDPLSNMRKSLGGTEIKSTRNQNKPVIAFDEKGSHSVREPPKSTKNSDSKISTYSYNRLFQQATANQEQTRQKSKPSKPSTPLIKSEQKDNEVSPTSPSDEKKPFIYFMTSLERFHREYDQNNYFCQIYREHFMQTFQAMVFCRYLKPVDHKVLSMKKVTLSRKDIHKDKKTLIFDLDETLIHCNESSSVVSDVVLPIKFPHGEVIEAGINVRPYAFEILKELSQYYEIVIFTASHSSYANVVLDYLDPQNQYIQHRLYREHCTPTEEGVYIKDLRVIGNRNMQDMIIVDNAAYSFGYQIENGIPIVPFYDNKTDQELKHLIPYLKFLSAAKDPREINKLTFKLHSYSQYSTPSQVLDNLIFQE